MRLLRREDDGHFTLTDFTGSNIPQYAILSHTWGSDGDEITLKELVDNADASKNKSGYRKIIFCTDQATKDGLEYVWIDTCCIDKSSSAELSEAINSMFRWYQEASKCYVYLSDVSTGSVTENRLNFENSRWFTRGWTLQELVAPESVEFFSLEGEKFGDKSSLVEEIAKITGISIHALQNHPLSDFSVAERMSWAARRETKREEDAAYSLLGLFDVQMPLLYGERREKALNRLYRTIQESTERPWPDLSLVPASMSSNSVTRPQITLNHLNGPVINTTNNRIADAQQRIFDSLQFSQLQERRDQIHEAYGETYRWILEPMDDRSQKWDDLAAWLSSPTESKRIYWIHGKPGSGKSTLMRFLDENITTDHMLPWSKGKTGLCAQYFFWNPGAKLQKTLTGLLRTILLQLLEQQPHLVPEVVGQRKWSAALRPGNNPIGWTNTELKQSLYQLTRSVKSSETVFLLLDGLDELDGSDDTREELINFLFRITSPENVKVCISSRPWNIFQDAFHECPQLRLEDLTRDDIYMYIMERLGNNPRFQQLKQHAFKKAHTLVYGLIRKAAGVFLWVCLVVKQLLQDLRDGCGIDKLMESLDGLPSDLNHYFKSLMNSISPHQRREASMLLQIVLYEETEFASLHPLRLVDLFSIDEGRPDFILAGKHRFEDFSPANRQALEFRLDSVHRRLTGCCMGMIECYHPNDSDLYQAFDLNVSFLHRSCRDFLSIPEVHDMLQQDTNGPYDARMYLLNSRVSQFMALAKVWGPHQLVLGLASYILCSLARPSYRSTSVCTSVATFIQPTLEGLIPDQSRPREGYWYIYESTKTWHAEQSSFLTMAIDFNLDAYVKSHLTREYILSKRGRPVLDYMLRCRFTGVASGESISADIPHTEWLDIALRLGADPNQIYKSESVWALFLCYLADGFDYNTWLSDDDCPSEDRKLFPDYSDTLELLIEAGAATLLPKSWLEQKPTHSRRAAQFRESRISNQDRFARRWPGAMPVSSFDIGAGSETWYAVSDLLQHCGGDVRFDVDRLTALLRSKESKEPGNAGKLE